ncbi:hypothetical protein Lgee_0928 [Legionella geestiana]|uniref:Uncharacterized protein n=1 Tax=Legionella geestiana TaxID=45065 RepID=A0A0W0TY56_9GAMM|nr:hypothetical protein [Legionella geestiana]KTD00664.1 hypothetical protein Lgee_0928 [Legionella geestiana]QBS11723.1 hypothetical protein E4T54_02620 [Legionella geestiana]STX53588.1 Uncharacterised protein [Legionella geestiana]
MPGNKVSVYQGKYTEVLNQVMMPGLVQSRLKKDDAVNWSKMWTDLPRTRYLLTDGSSLEEYLLPLVSWEPNTENDAAIPYMQGEINSSIWNDAFIHELVMSNINEEGLLKNPDGQTLEQFSFVYLDDTKTLCGVSVVYQKNNPEIFYASVIRNCRAPANEREVFCMVSETISTRRGRECYPDPGHLTELHKASQQFRGFLRSRELYENMHDLFTGRAVNIEAHARFDATKNSSSGETKTLYFEEKIQEQFPGSILSNDHGRRVYSSAQAQRAALNGKPLRIRGNYTEVSNFLNIGYQKDRPEDIARDISRMTYVDSPANPAEAYLSRLETWVEGASVEDGLRYNQGDLDAGHFSNFLPVWISLQNPGVQQETREISKFSFAYIDDNGVPCGMTIQHVQGTPHWTASIIRNTLAKPEEREVEFLCSPEIAATLPPSSEGVELTLTESTQAARDDFMQRLDSGHVSKLLHEFRVFTDTGEPSSDIGELQGEGQKGVEFRKRAPDFATRINPESSEAAQSRPSDEESLAERIGKLAFKSPPPAAKASSSGFRLNVQTGDNSPRTAPARAPAPSFFERNKFSLPLTIAAGVAAVALVALAGVFTAGIVPTILGVCGIVAGGICIAGAVKVLINEKEEKARLQEAERGQQGSEAMMLKAMDKGHGNSALNPKNAQGAGAGAEMDSRLRGNDTGAGAAPKPVKGILRKGDSPQKSTKRVQFDLPKEDTGAGVGFTDSDDEDDSLTDSTGPRLGMNG